VRERGDTAYGGGMHRSRIGLVLIDHDGEHFEPSVAFWAGVQGARPVREGPFTSVGEVGTLSLEVQRLDEGPSRIHLDIETDDVRAEVARLEALGATLVEDRDSWVVMADPGGVVFCVVAVQTGDRFTEDALEWP
jgi:hypothetical protein